jgi:S-adenosylmethionine hydrolase
LAVTTDRGQIFVVPDNGIITLAARESGISSAYQVSNEDLFSRPIQDMGIREIMGTVAGLLASGLEPSSLGSSMSAPQMLELQDARVDGASLVGSVVYVDNFGNSLTNIDTALLSELGLAAGQSIGVTTPNGTVQAVLGWSYGDLPRGDPAVLLNPQGGLELAINFGNFSETHGVQSGSAVRIAPTP